MPLVSLITADTFEDGWKDVHDQAKLRLKHDHERDKERGFDVDADRDIDEIEHEAHSVKDQHTHSHEEVSRRERIQKLHDKIRQQKQDKESADVHKHSDSTIAAAKDAHQDSDDIAHLKRVYNDLLESSKKHNEMMRKLDRGTATWARHRDALAAVTKHAVAVKEKMSALKARAFQKKASIITAAGKATLLSQILMYSDPMQKARFAYDLSEADYDKLLTQAETAYKTKKIDKPTFVLVHTALNTAVDWHEAGKAPKILYVLPDAKSQAEFGKPSQTKPVKTPKVVTPETAKPVKVTNPADFSSGLTKTNSDQKPGDFSDLYTWGSNWDHPMARVTATASRTRRLGNREYHLVPQPRPGKHPGFVANLSYPGRSGSLDANGRVTAEKPFVFNTVHEALGAAVKCERGQYFKGLPSPPAEAAKPVKTPKVVTPETQDASGAGGELTESSLLEYMKKHPSQHLDAKTLADAFGMTVRSCAILLKSMYDKGLIGMFNIHGSSRYALPGTAKNMIMNSRPRQ